MSHRITARAAEIAGDGGFESATIGRLAAELGLDKSEVSAHFATDELLQQSIVHAGAEVFREHVTDRAADAPEGIEKLRALLFRWVDYAQSDAYKGGFVGGAAELPDHIRDLIASMAQGWVDRLADLARIAVEERALSPDTDPEQVAFEVHGLVQEANWAFRVLSDQHAYDRARRGIEHRVGRKESPS